MTRVEITDEMIERAYNSLGKVTLAPGITHGHFCLEHSRDAVRKALDAALNPPAEPEIPVSEGMRRAGSDARAAFEDRTKFHVGRFWYDGVAEIYRAMEKKRREENKCFPKPRNNMVADGTNWVWCDACQCSYGPGSAHSFDHRKPAHRRKDDPK